MILFSWANHAFSQPTFAWTDATFAIGSRRIILLQWNLDGPCSSRPCYNFQNNSDTFDTLLTFVKANPTVKIEIACHSDTRPTADYNLAISTIRAAGIREELLKLGIAANQFETKGYGESKPLIPEKAIKKIKNKAKRSAMHRMNQRIEVIITALDNGIK